MLNLNVYDFDNTIYRGESAFDFFVYCVKKSPSQLKLLPVVLNTLIKYKRCKITHDELIKTAEKYALKFINSINNPHNAVSEFWDKHQHKIYPYYLKNKKDDDVIISASPSFLLNEIANRLNIQNLICSEVDEISGKIYSLCFADNKPVLFRQKYPNSAIDNFYTDSLNDMPMINISQNAYMVKHGKITKIK